MRVIALALKALLSAIIMGIVASGVWIASSLAATWNGPTAVVVLCGALAFPILPLAWELVARRRKKRRAETSFLQDLDRRKRDRLAMTFGDRLMLRTLVLNAAFVAAMLIAWPSATNTALTARGDWMLDGREGPVAARARQVLFAIADSTEFLHDLGEPDPYRGLNETRPPAPPKPDPKPAVEPEPKVEPAVAPQPPDAVPEVDTEPVPEVEPIAWPLPPGLHPLVVDPPPHAEVSIEALGTYLRLGEPDERMRLKALHDWVIDNIVYDFEALDDGSYKWIQDAQTVFREERGVCAGYANLMVAVGEQAGLEVVYLTGDTRTGDGSLSGTGHAWNAARVDGDWLLIDATWDAGRRAEDGTFEKLLRTDYLFTPPEYFVHTHLPQDEGWQLLDTPVSRGQFARAPVLRPAFFAQGLAFADPIRSQLTVQDQVTLVLDNPQQRSVMVSTLPRAGGEHVDCEVRGRDRMTVECPFEYPGDYKVIVYTADRKGEAHWEVGWVQVNARGTKMARR